MTAAPDEIPPALVDQRAVGGKMVVGTTNQEMVIVEKTRKSVTHKRTNTGALRADDWKPSAAEGEKMERGNLIRARFVGAVACVVLTLAFAHAQETRREIKKDVPFVPTMPEIVDEMLRLANVGRDDVVYDLGCGDGRLVITAVKKFGAKRGVGVDIDPQRIKESKENAQAAGVAGRVKFVKQDLFKTDISEATVVVLYLLPEVNLRLRPKLWAELRPGTRVVSNAFDMGDWKYEKIAFVGQQPIYFWTIPATPPAAKQ